MATTYAEIQERTGISIPAHLQEEFNPPTIQNGWAQGDVYIAAASLSPQGEGISITGLGHKVVKGDADRNSHVLNGTGLFFPGRYVSDMDYGLLLVREGEEAVLTHTGEHGSVIIPSGTWRLWGQASHESTLRRAAD